MGESLCGVGYMESKLPLIEKAISEGRDAGQAVLDRLPRDKAGDLRVEACPVFVGVILRGSTPHRALLEALEADTSTLLAAAEHAWKEAYEAQAKVTACEEAIVGLLEDVLTRDVFLSGPGMWAADEPAKKLLSMSGIDVHLVNLKFLIDNLWIARGKHGAELQRLRSIEKAIGVFSNNLPFGTVRRGQILVQRDRERMKAS